MNSTFTWSDLKPEAKTLVCAAWSQAKLGDLGVAVCLADDRAGDTHWTEFNGTCLLPWDAEARVTGDGNLYLSGMSEPSGRGFPVNLMLPLDVKLQIDVFNFS